MVAIAGELRSGAPRDGGGSDRRPAQRMTADDCIIVRVACSCSLPFSSRRSPAGIPPSQRQRPPSLRRPTTRRVRAHAARAALHPARASRRHAARDDPARRLARPRRSRSSARHLAWAAKERERVLEQRASLPPEREAELRRSRPQRLIPRLHELAAQHGLSVSRVSDPQPAIALGILLAQRRHLAELPACC